MLAPGRYGATAAGEPIVEDAGSDLAPLPRPGAVAQEVSGAVAVAVLGERQSDPLALGPEPARQKLRPGVSRVDDRFELRRREQPGGDDPLGEVRDVVGDGRRDRAHRRRLDERGRMIARGRERDPAGAVGEIYSCGFAHRCRLDQPRIFDRPDLVADGRAIDARRRRRAAADGAEHRDGRGAPRRGLRQVRRRFGPVRDRERVDQGAHVGAVKSRRGRESLDAVDDIDPDGDRRAVLAEGAAQAERGPHGAARNRCLERTVRTTRWSEAVRHDGDQAPAGRELAERGAKVPHRRHRVAAPA